MAGKGGEHAGVIGGPGLVVEPGGVPVDILAPGGPAVLDHPALEGGGVGGVGPVARPQGGTYLGGGKTGEVQIEGFLPEPPGIGGGFVRRVWHRGNIGNLGRPFVRRVRLLRKISFEFRVEEFRVSG